MVIVDETGRTIPWVNKTLGKDISNESRQWASPQIDIDIDIGDELCTDSNNFTLRQLCWEY